MSSAGDPDLRGMADDGGETDLADLFDELEELEELVQTEAAREQIQETMRVAAETSRSGGTFGRIIWGYDRGDLAEGLLGSLLFGIPMAVEGGTGEVGAFLAARPPLFAGTALFILGLLVGILYVADFQDIRIHRPLFGVLPRRLVGVAAISFLTGVVLLTAWGRVDWAEPTLALANVVVAWLPMSIGAALGDILPGS